MEIDEGLDAAAFAVAVAVKVAVVVAADTTVSQAMELTVTVVVSVLLGDVEPDVRLKITAPASMKNGEKLPLLPNKQVLLNGFMLPQQNKGLPSTSTRFIA